MATRVELNQAAPDFSLADFEGRPVRLADYLGRSSVLLIFNRGFY
jgi:peroxiredoxin